MWVSNCRRARHLRRALVRTVYAQIDGTAYALKQLALRRAMRQPGVFTAKETASLSEIPATAAGGKEVKPRFMSSVDNLRFGLKMLVKGREIAPVVSTGELGWNTLRAAIPIRNRIVHPKRVSQLHVSGPETILVVEAGIWLAETFQAALSTSLDLLEQDRQQELERHRDVMAGLAAERAAEEERYAAEMRKLERLREAEIERYNKSRRRLSERNNDSGGDHGKGKK